MGPDHRIVGRMDVQPAVNQSPESVDEVNG